MELVNEFVNNQFALYIPVALVLVGAILVFAFGFKSAEQPPFDKLSSISSEDRKTPGKKRKLKEKKPVVNGNIINAGDSKGDKSPSKEPKRKEQENNKKVENANKANIDKKKNESAKSKIEEKNKKNLKTKVQTEKPLDFDDGNWETVPTKGDKKKKQDSPVKKEKKNKKSDKALEIDKLVKDVVNKELQEKEKLRESPTPILNDTETKNEEVTEVNIEPVEVKKDKKAEKKSKKSDIEKIDINQSEKKVNAAETPTPTEVKTEETPAPIKTSGSVAFDELGDVWTEAKQPKKSKKKSRRDN